MSRGLVLALAIAVAVAALLFVPRVLDARTKAAAGARCRALKNQLALLRTQGGSAEESARLQVQIRLCEDELEAIGGTVDRAGSLLETCNTITEQLAQEFAHFKNTDYSDWLKRDNTRRTILRLGSEQVRCFGEVAATPNQTPTQRARLARSIQAALDLSDIRANCYNDNASGCARYAGSPEENGQRKTENEDQQIRFLLRALLKRVSLQDARATRNAERLEGAYKLFEESGGRLGTPRPAA